ncbi:MAG TPA: amidase [Candidatus Binataceae bacterium]|nr:amidase [Candidatus Binataceae bacterium]
MDTEQICFLSIADLGAMLRARKISSSEVTRSLLDRIRQLDWRLHSYITVLEESALAHAAQADREIEAGRWRGPLHGVPVSVKDLCQTRGALTTAASKVLREWRPDSSATVVTRLEAAGAVMLGKLNQTEFAGGWYHPEFPVPINPWNPAIWPGASSSGSGVATAAGLCFASIGTDTGGSIRAPSAACGVVGIKPTWGRVSRHGVVPLAESLDHVGPMARTVGDAALMLAAIAGYDPLDDTSLRAPVNDYSAMIGKGIEGIRIGVDEKFIARAAPEVGNAVIAATRMLEQCGARIVTIMLPDFDPIVTAGIKILACEAVAAHSKTYPAQSADYGPGFRSMLEVGESLRGADYANAQLVREQFGNRFQAFFEDVDVIACPSLPRIAIPAGGGPPDAKRLLEGNPLMRFMSPFNMSRNPTLSMPCGAGAPPPSLQLIARRLGEATLIQAGAVYEAATEWHRLHPSI